VAQQQQAHAQLKDPGLADYFYFVIVGGYLTVAMLFLLIAGRLDPGVSFRKLVKGALRRKAKGQLQEIQQEDGFCYICKLPTGLISDADGRSRLKVYENGRPLPLPHCVHTEIRECGQGRFSHWGDRLYFSSTDNTNPLENGRKYTFSE